MSEDTNIIFSRAAEFQPATFNADKRTVQVTWSTGADVMRSDWEGPFVERLSLEASAVDLSQLRGGPLLDNHDRFTGVRAILGVVEDASVNGTEGVATVRFSERHQDIATDVREGIIRSVSAGYTVQTWQTTKRADGVRVKTAVRWTPKEISFTPLAADAGAKTRSAPQTMNEQLQVQIRSAATLLGLPTTWTENFISTNPEASIEQARAAAVAEIGKQQPTIINRAPAMVTRDGNEGLATRMADGLLSRLNPRHKPEAGREFAHSRVEDLARACLAAHGLSTLGSAADVIARAMMTTSDFSTVFSEALNKSLLELRGSDRTPIEQIFAHATASDFRKKHVLELSDGQALEKVKEGGVIRFGKFEDRELSGYAMDSYAKGYLLSFQALTNDDLGVLSDVNARATRGARNWFASFLVDTLVANPKLADNKAVFHVDHGNLAASGSVITEDSLQAAKLAMRTQRDINGVPLNLTAKYIVIPAALEATVDKLMATLYPQQPADASVAARSLTPIVDSRLDAKSITNWYLFADPNEAPVLEVSELSGYSGPQIETENGFDYLGVKIRVVWHAGAGAIDGRGGWKNPGA